MIRGVIKSHFKTEYVMVMNVNADYHKQNVNDLKYCAITQQNIEDFNEQDFISKSLFFKGNYIGVYKEEIPVGFISYVLKGEKGDYFNVNKSDMYLQKIFVFPKFRGNKIAMDMISYCISMNIQKGRVALCVRPDNLSAIRCYEKMGFEKLRKVKFIRFVKDYSFPRFNI